jgi:hypothetical protein
MEKRKNNTSLQAFLANIPMSAALKRLLTIFLLTFFSLQAPAANQNIAVFGGGGVNSYASLYLAELFYKRAGLHFSELFDIAFGVSGGTFPATLLMHAAWQGQESIIAKAALARAFPTYWDLLNLTDSFGKRRKKFVAALEPMFYGLSFGPGNNNRYIYVGSHKGQPVFFCDPEVLLDETELRCAENTPCIDGIMASSSFSARISKIANTDISLYLFQPQKFIIMPHLKLGTVVDGTHCSPEHKGRFVVDGATPTPLAIDYAKKIPGKHNVVVFDNGGPFNSEFRKSIGVNSNGMATIVNGNAEINIFIISLDVDYFALNALNTSDEYSLYLENQVKKAISQRSRVVFNAALSAVLSAEFGKIQPPNKNKTLHEKSHPFKNRAKL